MVSMIVAQADNRVIGKSNELPWYLPADLKRFREITTGHSVIMGRKTYDSIYIRLGHPLPNRQNIVVTRDKSFDAHGCVIVASPREALGKAGTGEIFVIGGASIFQSMLPQTTRIY